VALRISLAYERRIAIAIGCSVARCSCGTRRCSCGTRRYAKVRCGSRFRHQSHDVVPVAAKVCSRRRDRSSLKNRQRAATKARRTLRRRASFLGTQRSISFRLRNGFVDSWTTSTCDHGRIFHGAFEEHGVATASTSNALFIRIRTSD